jgi:hypothetical protein
MNIGDKVRMIRSTEQGVITRLMSGGRAEIEIEDGFRIPVLQSEIVVVSPMEAERFRASETAANLREAIAPQRTSAAPPTGGRPGQIVANVGFYLAFVPQNDREVALYLVNNTDWEILLSVAEEREGRFRGLQSLTLKAKTQAKLLEQYQMERFEQWPTLLVQAVYFRPGAGQPARMPLVKRLKPRAPQFLKNKLNVPILNQPGHVFLLDDDANPQPTNVPATKPANVPEQLKTAMLSPNDEPPTVSIDRPASVVDLHIEALLPAGPGGKAAGELVDIQLRAFEKNLENAIASGMGEITFIHGVGSGKLRQELHRHLSRHPNVRYFEDAQKQKFGYGATKVTLK